MLNGVLEVLEKLWDDLRLVLEEGVSLADAVALGGSLTRSVNFASSALDLLVVDNPSLASFRVAALKRLDPIRSRARSLLRLANRPLPPLDAERMRRSLEQAERGEGVDVADLLAELRGQ